MSQPVLHHFLTAEGFFGGLLTLQSDVQQLLGRQNDRIAPLNISAVSSTADKSHIAADDLGVDVGHEVLFQAIRIGRAGRLFLHSHCRNSPTHHSHAALGECGTTRTILKLKSVLLAKILGCAASCSVLKRQKNISDLRGTILERQHD